jgi:hypothetical protein
LGTRKQIQGLECNQLANRRGQFFEFETHRQFQGLECSQLTNRCGQFLQL